MTNRNYCFLKSNSTVVLGGIPRLSNLPSAVSVMKVPSTTSIDTYWWSLPPALHGPPSLPHPRILLPENLLVITSLVLEKKKRLRFTPNIGSVWTNRSRFGLRFGLPYRNEVRSPNRARALNTEGALFRISTITHSFKYTPRGVYHPYSLVRDLLKL
jgi:hypothetical protein